MTSVYWLRLCLLPWMPLSALCPTISKLLPRRRTRHVNFRVCLSQMLTTTQFTAWATYTDGNIVGAEGNLTKLYHDCLKHLARLSTVKVPSGDVETENRFVLASNHRSHRLIFLFRTRLVGLAALTSVVNSNAFMHPSANFAAQCDIIVPALLTSLWSLDLVLLQEVYVLQSPEPKWLLTFVQVRSDKGSPKPVFAVLGAVPDAPLRREKSCIDSCPCRR